ncbi:hypothetical protein A2276_07695 [candidate division WOR-1 bacterium RIFOXYA12_FULL_43_27]|uniref:AAA+ ATPase domain-containing protein n=1 Tax=candidate division WOR-1 bacterium RIFOXYC2_FULL_46_14 TaxID=1802587 RepID=A0A1F4U5W1_UNCSA|nr:MAG: hypothetical protein A2276_07695 [candidate division WOR-1 bacterium RIFOXYA12_FULL_43_27]OGC20481.1 MAG: hypothetical protein A2292_05520 [candidate division WOR-1 bacterium RIFOXYB2_FULL_46_45]OGC31782.1 MAG: hypothetical protein A2232_05930 [candidate division WOR-1 bacterium RIFOXYA2_FULL_46_56]OGC40326.1 MAG: hypothetical protein A2438_03540 [candidate division WOR-1 bacterium RIFOXYC2_FULL_46_14]
MYREYWNLREKPFENTPNPEHVYLSMQHEEAFSRVLYVIRQKKGAAVITGEYGAGKTLLTRMLLRELATGSYQTALVLNPMLSPTQLIREIMHQLGEKDGLSVSKAELFNRLNQLLVEIKEKGKSTVIIIDEAQAIRSSANFEEFRLLLNFQLDNGFLLTILLFGQPELKEKIEKLPQLKQRLALRFHLKGLSRAETREYLSYRISSAGGNPEIFLEEAVEEIYNYSRGIPRMINNLCDLCLLIGSGKALKNIERRLVEKVVADLERGEWEEKKA